MPKLAQILGQPNSTQQVYLFFVFTVNICITQKDSILLTWVCSVMGLDHRGYQNTGKNTSDTLGCGSCANNKSGLLIKSSRLEISELQNYFTKM